MGAYSIWLVTIAVLHQIEFAVDNVSYPIVSLANASITHKFIQLFSSSALVHVSRNYYLKFAQQKINLLLSFFSYISILNSLLFRVATSYVEK